MLKKIIKNKNLLTLFISTIIFLLVYFFSYIDSNNSLSRYSFFPFYSLNKSIQNNFYQVKNRIISTKPNKDIIVVEIDEKTLSELWSFPFDRKIYVPLLDNLKESWVWVIAFDIIFADNTNKESDFLFSEAIKRAWNVVLWISSFNNWLPQKPLDIFLKNSFSNWFLIPNIDNKNNIVYSFFPLSKFRNGINYEYFALSILRAYYSNLEKKDYTKEKWNYEKNYYKFKPNINIPLSETWKDSVLINFIDNKMYKKISFFDIYDKKRFNEIKKYTNFKDKIVIVWSASQWIKDVFNTPNWIEYGMYVHVNTINTILNQSYLVYFNKNLEWFLIFSLILLSVYFNFNKSGYTLFFTNISILTIFLLIFPYSILIFTNFIENYFTELVFSFIFSIIVSNIIKYITENKSKVKLNKALSEYVSSDVANEILSWTWEINLDWEKKRIAIFFSDIEWFTTISEKFSPELLVSFLRKYLTLMSNIIMDEKGFINKYEWDAIMALWWVFWFVKNTSFNACKSALYQQKLLKELNIEWKNQGFSEIKARIWIHIWDAIVWNIWSEGRKMEFTALWDSVNLASRLEWVNKFYWTYICVSEDIYSEVKDLFEFRYLDKIKVKWKTKWINIYELISIKWEILEEKQEIVKNFLEAIELYKNREFDKALVIFSELADLWDKPSETYKKRCENYLINTPSLDWDWTFEMAEK